MRQAEFSLVDGEELTFQLDPGSVITITTSESFLDLETGRIVVPDAEANDQTFHIELELIDSTALTFKVDRETTLSWVVAPSPMQYAFEMVGYWRVATSTQKDYLLFRSDGIYEQV